MAGLCCVPAEPPCELTVAPLFSVLRAEPLQPPRRSLILSFAKPWLFPTPPSFATRDAPCRDPQTLTPRLPDQG